MNRKGQHENKIKSEMQSETIYRHSSFEYT